MSTAVVKKDEKQNSRITPHQPYSMFHKLQAEMNKLFEDARGGFGFMQFDFPEHLMQVSAKVDIKDAGDEIVVVADVPGVEMADLDITATKNYLSIIGEKKAEKADKDSGYYSMEREYGYFRRVVPLPCEVQNDKVDAVFKNGVLTITMPKTREALAEHKKVTVKAG